MEKYIKKMVRYVSSLERLETNSIQSIRVKIERRAFGSHTLVKSTKPIFRNFIADRKRNCISLAFPKTRQSNRFKVATKVPVIVSQIIFRTWRKSTVKNKLKSKKKKQFLKDKQFCRFVPHRFNAYVDCHTKVDGRRASRNNVFIVILFPILKSVESISQIVNCMQSGNRSRSARKQTYAVIAANKPPQSPVVYVSIVFR